MALIHTDADLSPGKLELLAVWLPRQPWGSPEPLVRLATFRFDDPDGEVGMETFLLRAGELVLHVPLTYRGAPLEGGGLVGKMEHSALGHRWVYDGPTDDEWASLDAEHAADGLDHAVLQVVIQNREQLVLRVNLAEADVCHHATQYGSRERARVKTARPSATLTTVTTAVPM